MKYNKGKGFPFKKIEEEEENPVTTKTGSPDVVPTSRDRIQSYIHSQIPESLKGRVEKIDKDIVEKSEKSAEITPDMTFEDFEKAKSTLGIETNEELLKYLTGKDKKDLPIYLRPFIKG